VVHIRINKDCISCAMTGNLRNSKYIQYIKLFT
jgi:hypothetical protein